MPAATASVASAPPPSPQPAGTGTFAISSAIGPAGAGAVLISSCDGKTCRFMTSVTSDAGSTWRSGGIVPWNGALLDPSSSPGESLQRITYAAGRYWVSGAELLTSVSASGPWARVAVEGSVDAVVGGESDVWVEQRACHSSPGCTVKLTAAGSDGRIDRVDTVTLPDAAWAGVVVRDGRMAYLTAGDDNVGTSWLMRSLDDGATWSRVGPPKHSCWDYPSGSMAVAAGHRLLAVCAPGAATGSVAKTVYSSTDLGARWSYVGATEYDGYATGLAWGGGTVVWRSGGRAPVYRSLDGGRTWAPQLAKYFDDAGGPLTVSVAGATVWVGGGVDHGQLVLHVTHDVGRHWAMVRLALPVLTSNALALAAVDAHVVGALMKDCDAAVCSYRLAVSVDGGKAWSHGGVITTDTAAEAGPLYGSDQVQGVVAVDPQHWFSYGKHLWLTRDAGRSWRRVPDIGTVSNVALDNGTLIAATSACASLGHCRNHLEAVTTGGVVTRLAAAWAPSTLRLGQVVRESGAWMVEAYSAANKPLLTVVQRHGDALVLLASRPLPCLGGDAPTLAATGGSALVLSCGGDGAAGTEDKQVWRSEDDGRQWTRLPDPARLGYGHELAVGRTGLLWRYGYRSAVYRSLDSGRSWMAMLTDRVGDAGGEEAGFAAYGDNAWVAAYAVAYKGMAVYVTHDAGRSWSKARLSASTDG